jgi:hypothetical protein
MFFLGQINEGGQETRQRFTAACGGDEQQGGGIGTVQHLLLVRVQGPAVLGKPIGEFGG